MTLIKVHYKRVELTHDGYCSGTGEDDLFEKYYDSDDESIQRVELYSSDIPEEQFEENCLLKSEYWYNYVPWKENEVMEDMSAGHCCCPPIGIIYKIFKVEKTLDEDET